MATLAARIRARLGFNPLGWLRARKQMDMRVAEFLPTIGPADNGPDTVVIISPWEGTAIPWFTLVVGLMLAKKGAPVRFVLDDMQFGGNPFRHRFVLAAIRHVMRRVAARFEVMTLSDFGPVGLGEAERAEIERLARLNATWALRGEMPQRGRAELERRAIAEVSRAQSHIAAFFAAVPLPDLLFLPGGVFADSGMWLQAAQSHGIRVATFDTGGYETTMLATDGMACQLQDVPRAFEILRKCWASGEAGRDAALERADEEIAKRREGTDTFISQVSGAGSGSDHFDGGVLLALNSSWDAAALGPHRAFASNTEWIIGTVRHLLEQTDKPVIVRQHPAERLAIAATSDDYRRMLKERIGEHERLHFIAAEDPINSYALLERVAAVVVHTSTIGLEAVAFGRPVVTGSASYYSGLGFVARSDDRAGYEALLSRAAAGQLQVSERMKEEAKLCFYITQCRNWVFSTFNPADFYRWIERPIAHWQSQPAVTRMVEALIAGVPVAVLNHRAAISAKP